MARRLFSRRLMKLGEIPRIAVQNQCSPLCFIGASNYDLSRNPYVPIPRNFATNRPQDECPKEPEKLSLFQRFKQMYRDYWYVLVPVHAVTSVVWFSGFYYLAKSGVDIVSLLEKMHFSEKIVDSMRDSKMGHVAVAYGIYKVTTPVRYTVTLGGTTISINYLKQWGYIKPVPSAERLKEMYHEGKGNLIETIQDTKDGIIHQKEELKDKKDDLIEDLKHMTKIKEQLKDKRDDIIEDLKHIKRIKEHMIDGVKKKK